MNMRIVQLVDLKFKHFLCRTFWQRMGFSTWRPLHRTNAQNNLRTKVLLPFPAFTQQTKYLLDKVGPYILPKSKVKFHKHYSKPHIHYLMVRNDHLKYFSSLFTIYITYQQKIIFSKIHASMSIIEVQVTSKYSVIPQKEHNFLCKSFWHL